MPVVIRKNSLENHASQKTYGKGGKNGRKFIFSIQKRKNKKQENAGNQPVMKMNLQISQMQKKGVHKSSLAGLGTAEKIAGKISY